MIHVHPLQQHKKDTENWLTARNAEIDLHKAGLAADRAQLKADQAKLKADTAKLAADSEALDAKVAAFEESRRQMETIMNRIKGIS